MMRPQTRTTVRSGVLLTTCLTLAMPAALNAQARTEVRVSGGLGVENNPFLLEDGDDGGVAVAAEVEVAPNITIENGRTSFRLFGNARLRQFFNDFGTTGDLLLGAQGNTRVDERTQLSAGANVQTSRSAAQDALIFGGPSLIDLEPGVTPVTPVIDPTIAGAQGRFTSFGVNASADRQLTERDNLSLGLAFTHSSTAGDQGFDFRVADAIIGYGRRLNERTVLRANVNLSRSDFIDQQVGDAFTVTPLVGLQQQVSPRLNWSAQVGASFSRVDDGRGGTINNTGLAFSANACRRDVRGALCLSADRQARPTIFAGLAEATGVTVSYDLQLNRRDTVRADATYRRSDRIATPLLSDQAVSVEDEFYGVSGTYRRAFTDRFSGFVTASYAQIDSDLFEDRDANIRGYVGVSYLFGRRR